MKTVVSHLYYVWIHPFGDSNGRGARVLEFRILMRAGVPLTTAHLLTSYY
ncbi:MAG: Fic family protein [Synergistaceae bacterium]|nr:Fic family protein [Synergistaceae bacterium]